MHRVGKVYPIQPQKHAQWVYPKAGDSDRDPGVTFRPRVQLWDPPYGTSTTIFDFTDASFYSGITSTFGTYQYKKSEHLL